MLYRVNWCVDTLVAAMAALLMVESNHGECGTVKGCLSQMFPWKKNGELDRMNAWFLELPRFTFGYGVSCLVASGASDG